MLLKQQSSENEKVLTEMEDFRSSKTHIEK